MVTVGSEKRSGKAVGCATMNARDTRRVLRRCQSLPFRQEFLEQYLSYFIRKFLRILPGQMHLSCG